MQIDPPDLGRPVYCLLGLPFDAIDLAAASRIVRTAVAERRALFVSTPNLNFLVACTTDAEFRNSVLHSELSVADGMPIVWLAKLLGVPIRERVAGSSLFEALREAPGPSAGKPLSVYFFGGPDGAAEKACARINAQPGAMQCAGFASPGFGSVQDMSNAATLQAINDSQADFVVVSLGARKGQAWIEHNRQQLNAPVISHLGAVVNMVAGTVLRAPRWMQALGLEWLWRIKEEPTLWRRYFDDGTALLGLLLTRALPLLWHTKVGSPGPNAMGSVASHADAGSQTLRITVSGHCVAQNLAGLRSALQQAVAQQHHVELDLAGATYVDSAFWGVLMLMHGYQNRVGRGMRLLAASHTVRRLGHYACVDFLWSGSK